MIWKPFDIHEVSKGLLLGVEDARLERHRLPREKYVDSDGRTQNSQLWEQIEN